MRRIPPSWPTLEQHWKAIRWHSRQLHEFGWSVDNEHIVTLYHLLDVLPPNEDRWVTTRVKLPDDLSKELQRNAHWYAKGAWRERLPRWRRWIFPLGPSRRTRRRLWLERGRWDDDARGFTLAPDEGTLQAH